MKCRFLFEWFTQELKGNWQETNTKCEMNYKTNLSNFINLNILIFNI